MITHLPPAIFSLHLLVVSATQGTLDLTWNAENGMQEFFGRESRHQKYNECEVHLPP